jgi:hypothetical protein
MATTRYVDPNAASNGAGASWDDPFDNIPSAIAAADPDDTVWVKAGYIILTADLDIDKSLSIYGGFQPSLTGTSGAVADRNSGEWTYIMGDSSYRGAVITDDDTTLDGFNITNCSGTDGGGICIQGGTSSTYWGANLLNDGDMEAITTGYWSNYTANLGKTTSYKVGGNRSLEVEATSANGYAYQTPFSSGNTYRVTGYFCRAPYGDNPSGTVYVKRAGTTLASTTSTSWQSIDTTTVATGTDQLRLQVGTSGMVALFDSFSVRQQMTNSGAIDNITITNCIISSSTATTGGGIFIENATTVSIDGVQIQNCTATNGAGIGWAEEYTGEIVGNTKIWDCTATTNGGGIYFAGNNASNAVDVEKSYIQGNAAGSNGGGVYEADNASAAHTLNRCVITDNTATTSGGVYVTSGTVTGLNCTISENDVRGWENNGGTSVVTNCIIWDNTTETTGTITMTYTDIQGGHAGTGNVNDDPEFFGGTNRLVAYSLGATSGAVDSGNYGASGFLDTDINGAALYDHPNVSNTGAGGTTYSDMGAYEFQGIPTNTLNMGNYYIDCSQADTADDYLFKMYAILRVPTLPNQFMSTRDVMSSPHTSLKIAKHRIQSEIEIDESDSTLDEWVLIDDVLSAHRRTDVGTTYTSPTRDADYDDLTKKSTDDHTAENKQLPVGIDCEYPGLEYMFRYVFVEMSWQPYVEDVNDVLYIYNVDFEQYFEDYSYNGFAVEAHPATTLLAPDMPLSAYHVRSILQDSLLKILHECRNDFSIPVFGLYNPVVV